MTERFNYAKKHLLQALWTGRPQGMVKTHGCSDRKTRVFSTKDTCLFTITHVCFNYNTRVL